MALLEESLGPKLKVQEMSASSTSDPPQKKVARPSLRGAGGLC